MPLLLLTSLLNAHQRCAVEVKILLPSFETEAALSSLHFEKESAGQVFFFDTDQLALLAQGAIVRVRQGAENDLTVKVRFPYRRKLSDRSREGEDFKCEIDMTGDKAVRSYSIRIKYAGRSVPEAGNEIRKLLSASQRKLLKEARVSIDWILMKRIANINSTGWETSARLPLHKLSLELWEYPGGNILEVSTKAAPGAGPATHVELQRLLNAKDLMLKAVQRSKTNMALEALAHRAAP